MYRLLLLLGLVGFYNCNSLEGKDVNKKEKAAAIASADKVLVELFTSQGCSSCPSADRLLSSIARADTNIITLSFHVDYWDRLGWKDVFSNHQYTLRQQQYASILHAESIYTPQAVVQGRYEMVGSNKNGIDAAVKKVRAENKNIIVSANTSVVNNTVTVNYHLNNSTPQQQVIAALIQNDASTNVKRGENAGATLSSHNIVRSLESNKDTDANGTLQLTLPADLSTANASVVLFVQNGQTKFIEGVTQVKL